MVWGSPRVQSPQVTLDVSANVPVRVQLMTGESAVVRQRSNRQIPAGYAQSVGIKPKKVIG
ncbi:hypothetical protein MB84_21785 [Pandoraea oxalativorans]|uniref:Uncharacterized protein n=2 Tax=Pandoraea oxalativorans TaxID=573737 RepID=A0A0E3U8Q4_9BURK|nr:hypothetical protein MB84_21785 [Pandoraea oxalativorans]